MGHQLRAVGCQPASAGGLGIPPSAFTTRAFLSLVDCIVCRGGEICQARSPGVREELTNPKRSRPVNGGGGDGWPIPPPHPNTCSTQGHWSSARISFKRLFTSCSFRHFSSSASEDEELQDRESDESESSENVCESFLFFPLKCKMQIKNKQWFHWKSTHGQLCTCAVHPFVYAPKQPQIPFPHEGGGGAGAPIPPRISESPPPIPRAGQPRSTSLASSWAVA